MQKYLQPFEEAKGGARFAGWRPAQLAAPPSDEALPCRARVILGDGLSRPGR